MAKQKKVMESEIIADDITRDCNSFEAWFIENGKLVAWGCVAIIIAVAVVFSIVQIRKSSQAKAYNTLASAVTEQQIQDALKQYPSGSVAAEARFRLAGLYIKAQNNKAAVEQLALVAADKHALAFTKGRAVLDAGYLYENDGMYTFMDTETYEQEEITKETLGDALHFLLENMEVQLQTFKGRIIGISLPNSVTLKVTECEPSVKGNTATGATKMAKVETGYEVRVPLFVNEGDSLRIDTRTGNYIERA